jgi:hypothetical protein
MRNTLPSGPRDEERLRFFNYVRRLGRTIAWGMLLLLICISAGVFFLGDGSRGPKAYLRPLILCVFPVGVLLVLKPDRKENGG